MNIHNHSMQAISTCAYNENMAKRERKILSLKEKVELIKLKTFQRAYHCDLVMQHGRRFRKPLVIGKSANPRCFKNIKIDRLPITWKTTAMHGLLLNKCDCITSHVLTMI